MKKFIFKEYPEDDAILNDDIFKENDYAKGIEDEKGYIYLFKSPCWMSSCEAKNRESEI